MSEENKNLNNAVTPEAEKAEKVEQKPVKTKKAKKAKKNGKSGLGAFLKSRKARHGSVAIIIVAITIAIVIVLNVICSLLVERFPDIKIDMTSNNSYALQEDTIDYMSHLDKDVTIYILMSKSSFEGGGTYLVQAQNLLDKMKSSSDGKLQIEYVDLNDNPTFTSKYTNIDWTNSTENYMILVECGEQYKVLTLEDCFEYDEETYYYYGQLSITGTTIEQAIVTAVLNVTTDDKVIVDMITGNQEQDYSAIKTLLENNAYQVNEVSLATQDIDEDAKAVMLYAPSVDLDESAITKLSEWLENDGDYGRTLIYIPTADMPDTPNLDDLLREWGMEVNSGYAYETSTDYLVSNTLYAFLVDYADYFTDGLKNPNIPVVVSEAHDITITDDTTAHGILLSSDKSGVQPYDIEKQWTYDDYMENITGSQLNIAAEGSKTNTDDATSRVIVFGSYLMFSNDIMQLNSYNNSGYLMNVFNTVADKDDTSIVIESKSLDNTELGVTDVTTKNIVMVIFVILIPVVIIIIGIVLWLRRRNR